MTLKTKVGASLLIAGAAMALQPGAAVASSHREAPMIAEDPAADNTDLWAFVSPDMPSTVTIIAGYIGLEEPGGGPNWAKFSDDVLYEIHVDNTQSGVANNLTFQFRFTTQYNPTTTAGATTGTLGTIFSNVGQFTALPTPTAFNAATVVQSMNVYVINNGMPRTQIGTNIPVAPPYFGHFAYGSGGALATSDTPYTNIANAAVSPLTGNYGMVYAGPRDDAFFADLGSIFDDVTFRSTLPAGSFGSQGGGIDYLAGYNVHIIALQVPINNLVVSTATTAATDVHNVIGLYASASRQRMTIRRDCTPLIAPLAAAGPLPTDYVRNCDEEQHGQWVQVSRLGIPLINEVIIPLGLKDWWNRSSPSNDVANFAPYLLVPSLPAYAQVLYGSMGLRAAVGYTAPARSLTSLTTNDMFELVSGQVGIAGVNTTAGMGLPPADLLRLNVRTPPSPLPTNVGDPTTLAAGNSRLGAAGGDTAGFPNGRRLFDDIIDIELRYVLNGLTHLNAIPFGDGVDGNDSVYQTTFPYMPIAHAGDVALVHRAEPARSSP